MKTTNKFKRLLALLALSGAAAAAAQLHAQETPVYKRGATVMENTMPPSPEPASAVKYADVPFDLSAGVARLEIPFYTLRGRELKIPISLSYAGGGVKLDEVAGVAGLGWTLNAGGCVTRTVMDMPDEFSAAAFSHGMPSGSLLAALEGMQSSTETLAFLRDVVWHRKDTSLDRYSYSVCGLSGTFVIADGGVPVLLGGDGVSIAINDPDDDGDIEGFTLTGPDGTVYTFTERETATHDGSSDQPFTPTSGEPDRWSATTAWHLTSVTSRSGCETAYFSYCNAADRLAWSRNVRSKSRTVSFSESAYEPESSSTGYSFNYIVNTYSTTALTSISLAGFTAAFSYAADTGSSSHAGSPGESLQNHPRRLTGITVSYAGQTPALASLTVNTGRAPYDGRIVLNGLRVYRGGSLDDRWDFTYNTLGTTVSHYSQDWYGYYNGECEGSGSERGDRCPYTVETEAGAPVLHLSHGVPDATAAEYMSLSSADHDGAKTEFAYEGNAYTSGSDHTTIGIRVSTIRVRDKNSLKRTRRFTYTAPAVTGPAFPEPGMYTTVSASQGVVSGSQGQPFEMVSWLFSVHENPVADGPSIRDTRVLYGGVTESDTERGALVESAQKTEYTFSTGGTYPAVTYTIGRFPSAWSGYYGPGTFAPTAVTPWTGVREWYADSGPSHPALLVRKTEYAYDGGSYTPVRRTDYSYDSPATASVLVDYKAVQVMQHYFSGQLVQSDIYHYPVYVRTFAGRNPVSTRVTEYHGSMSDTTSVAVSTSYVQRPTLSDPVRVSAASYTEHGVTRSMVYTYADTAPSPAGWMTALASQHCLSVPVRTAYSIVSGSGPVILKEEEQEYGTVPGSSSLLPKVHREWTEGTLSWSETVLSRDGYGNVTSFKETGRPVTDVEWGYGGLYPVKVTENPSAGQGALVSEYTFEPGVGLTSSTDPAGVTTYYEYDNGGRLSGIGNDDGDAVEGYIYDLLDNGGNGRLSIRHRTYRNASGTLYSEDVSWLNTLGLVTETISLAAAGDGRDLVSARTSDFMLHDDVKEWLPYPASTSGGSFQSGAESASASYHSSSRAYTLRRYEVSSRDRVLATAQPGYDGSYERTTSTSSLASFPCYVWRGSGVVQNGTYAAHELVAETIEDEDGRAVTTVRDHAGRTLGTSRGDDAPTYYVYDTCDRLRAVAGSGTPMSSVQDMWRYTYDSHGRLASKAVPGGAAEQYSYDSEDRLVSVSRPGETRTMTYDAHGRLTKVDLTRSGVTETVEEYTYDEYPSGVSWTGPTKGLKTRAVLAELDGDGEAAGGAVVTYFYDSKERPVRTVTLYPDGTVLTAETDYCFDGSVAGAEYTCTHGGASDVLTLSSSYDVRGRATAGTSVLSSGAATASVSSQYAYDALGRPSGRTSSVSDGATLASADTYNLQQRLVSHTVRRSGAALFSETLGYDTAPGLPGTSALRSGLVSGRSEQWTFPGQTAHTRTEGFAYDDAGRLTRECTSSSATVYAYDARGNLTSVTEGSSTTHFNLVGDRLASLSGARSASFSYDTFGRMTFDGLAGTAITYNHLDLPSKIASDGSTEVNYCYLADGSKTGALDEDGAGLVYRGPFTYRRAADSSLTLESAACPEGRLTPSGVMLSVTDHLGSVRAVMDGASGSFYEASDYSAYGARTSVTPSPQATLPAGMTLRDRFTGKEDQSADFAVPYLDFGARQYSPALRRWLVPDPQSEKYYGISPYSYCGGDPVNLVDPDGMNWYSYRDYDGVIQYKYVEGQMDSKEMTEGGYTDLGYTYIDTNTNTYYSLFGNILSLITSNNKMPLETAIYQHIDNLLIKSYTDIDNDSNRENFYTGIKSGDYEFSYNGLSFSSNYGYEGGTIFRAVNNSQNSVLHIFQMPPQEERRFGGLNNAPSWTGCFMILRNDKRFDAVQVNFNTDNARKFRLAIDNLFVKKK